MAIKFEKIKAGDILYDNHRTRIGNTTMSEMGEWQVRIIEVYPDKRSALVSWNSNKAHISPEYNLIRLYATPLRERKAKKEANRAKKMKALQDKALAEKVEAQAIKDVRLKAQAEESYRRATHPPMPPPKPGECKAFWNWDHFCTLKGAHTLHQCPCGSTSVAENTP